jgi:hypothetical protein
MFANGELIRIWKGKAVGCFKVLSWNWLREAGKTRKTSVNTAAQYCHVKLMMIFKRLQNSMSPLSKYCRLYQF